VQSISIYIGIGYYIYSLTYDILCYDFVTVGSAGVVNQVSIEISNDGLKVLTTVSTPVKRLVLEQRVYGIWPEFKIMSFSLSLHDAELTEDELVLYDGAVVVVLNHCRQFHLFGEPDALAYAKVPRIIVNDDIFHSSVAVRDADINFAREELSRRLAVCDIFQAGEFTMREFISPILVNALVSTPSVKLVGSRDVVGTLGHGLVDFLLIYCDFPICVTEAKREAVDKAVYHNIAQLIAAREAYCIRNKCSSEDIAEVPSCGIVSTGENFVFLRYICQGGEWIVIRSKAFKMTLDEHRPLSRDQVGTILSKVVGVIEFQVAATDSSVTVPRRVLPATLASHSDEESYDVE
jgi:hypothetical protein